MGTVRRTITLTDLQDRWVTAQIAAGYYTNDSEYVGDLIRRDRQRHADLVAIRVAVQEGLDSGPSDATVASITEEVEARLRTGGRL